MSRYIDTDTFDDTVQKLNEQGWHITRIDYKRMDRVLFEVPTADVVEVVHGQWIYDGLTFENDSLYKCSICCHRVPMEYGEMKFYSYCPNCGARMDL